MLLSLSAINFRSRGGALALGVSNLAASWLSNATPMNAELEAKRTLSGVEYVMVSGGRKRMRWRPGFNVMSVKDGLIVSVRTT